MSEFLITTTGNCHSGPECRAGIPDRRTRADVPGRGIVRPRCDRPLQPRFVAANGLVARHACGWLLFALLIAVAGCGQEPACFEPNLVYMRSQKLAERPDDFQTERLQARIKDIEHVLAVYFGAPDEPTLPLLEGVDLDLILRLDMLQMAAGSSQQSRPGAERGLFRQLCARCHGVSGSGTGPLAAGLNPHPRDYRRGIFKFKQTPSTLPPTNEDLHNVLVRGVPGTAMPSFRLLTEVQREALVHYVRYLSIRGLFERALIEEAAFELDENELLLDPKLARTSSTLYAQQMEILQSITSEVIQPWLTADREAVTVPAAPPDYGSLRSIARGRELFFTTLTNCATCHGATALGDGQTEDFDEWGKELEPTRSGDPAGVFGAGRFAAPQVSTAKPARGHLPRRASSA